MNEVPQGIDDSDFLLSDPWYVPEKENLVSTVHEPGLYAEDSGLHALTPEAIALHQRQNHIIRYGYVAPKSAGPAREERKPLHRKNPVFFYDMKFERMLAHEVIIGLLMHYHFENQQEFVDKCGKITGRLMQEYEERSSDWAIQAHKEYEGYKTFCKDADKENEDLGKAITEYLGTSGERQEITQRLEETLGARMKAVYAAHKEARGSKGKAGEEESNRAIAQRIMELVSAAPRKEDEPAREEHHPGETGRKDPAVEIDEAIVSRMHKIKAFIAATEQGIRPEEEGASQLRKLHDEWKHKVELEHLHELILPSLVEEDHCRKKTKILRGLICGTGDEWNGRFDKSRLAQLALEEGLKKLTSRDSTTQPPRRMIVVVGGQGSGKSAVGEKVREDCGTGNNVITLNTDWIKPLLFNKEETREDPINHATMAHQESFYVFDRIANRWWKQSLENHKTPSMAVEAARLSSWLRNRIRRGREEGIKLTASATTLPVEDALTRAMERGKQGGTEPGRFSPSRRLIVSHHDQYSHNLNAMLDGLPLDIYNTKGEPVLAAHYAPPVPEKAATEKGSMTIYDFPAMWDYFKKPKLNANARRADDLWHGTELATAFGMREYTRYMNMEFKAQGAAGPYMTLRSSGSKDTGWSYTCRVIDWDAACRQIGSEEKAKEFLALINELESRSSRTHIDLEALKPKGAEKASMEPGDYEKVQAHIHDAHLVARQEAGEALGISNAYINSLRINRQFRKVADLCTQDNDAGRMLRQQLRDYADLLRKIAGAGKYTCSSAVAGISPEAGATNANPAVHTALALNTGSGGRLFSTINDALAPDAAEYGRRFSGDDWVAVSARHAQELSRRIRLFDSAVEENDWKNALHHLFYRDGAARFPCFTRSAQEFDELFCPLPSDPPEGTGPSGSTIPKVPPLPARHLRITEK